MGHGVPTTWEIKATSRINHSSDNLDLEALHLDLSLLQTQQNLHNLHLNCQQNNFNNLLAH
jgi:hypothetical protein